MGAIVLKVLPSFTNILFSCISSLNSSKHFPALRSSYWSLSLKLKDEINVVRLPNERYFLFLSVFNSCFKAPHTENNYDG